MKLLIDNVKIIRPNEVLKGHVLEIEDGLIGGIKGKDNFNKNDYDKIIDAKGNFVSPGFIDIHNHGNSGFDTMDANIPALENMAKFHLKNGVTSFLAATMTSSTDKLLKAVSNVKEYINKEMKYSKLLGVYLEGPYFSLKKKGSQPAKYIKEVDINQLEQLIESSGNNIRVVSLAPEINNADKAIKYLKSRNIIVSLGHTNSRYEDAHTAVELGSTLVTHLYNGMRAFNHREPGIIGVSLTHDELMCEIICDGIHLHKSAIKLAVKAKGSDKIILISDAMRATGLNNGTYDLGGQEVFVKGEEARLADGTLAGSTLTLDRAVRNIIEMIDIPIYDAVKMASLNPAKAIGIEKEKGSIEKGKRADLVLFDGKINVLMVMKNGKIVE